MPAILRRGRYSINKKIIYTLIVTIVSVLLVGCNNTEAHLTNPDFKDEYLRLTNFQPETYNIFGKTIECGNILLTSNFGNADAWPFSTWMVESFDGLTGTNIYRYDNQSSGNMSSMFYMENWFDGSGFDYRLVLRSGVVYKDSKNPASEKFVPLPENVVEWSADFYNPRCFYDMSEDNIIWAKEDGVYLCQIDGSKERLILPKSGLLELFPDPQGYYGEILYAGPSFVCGGEKVVATVLAVDGSIGVVVYDISSLEISSTIRYLQPDNAHYPVADRYIAIRSSFGYSSLYDAETGEMVKSFPRHIGETYDFETFIVQDDTQLTVNNSPAYVCDISNMDDRSKMLFNVENPDVLVYFVDVTEHYAVFKITDSDGDGLAVIRYRI